MEEAKFSRAEIDYLSGLIRLEESRLALETPTSQRSTDEEDSLTLDLASGSNTVRDFLLKALPTRAPGKGLQQLVSEAEEIPLVEQGKSTARTLNANLLSLQTLKMVSRDGDGGWVRTAAIPVSGGFR
jgi:hypothetical protein